MIRATLGLYGSGIPYIDLEGSNGAVEVTDPTGAVVPGSVSGIACISPTGSSATGSSVLGSPVKEASNPKPRATTAAAIARANDLLPPGGAPSTEGESATTRLTFSGRFGSNSDGNRSPLSLPGDPTTEEPPELLNNPHITALMYA